MSNGASDRPLSLWDTTAVERGFEAPFVPDGPVDVAIVGGGFTGLSTALHTAEAGLSAQVLEAKQIGYGGSGRNVGLVNAGVWLPPGQVNAALGDTYGPRFLETFGDGPRRVFDLIEKHQIRCEAVRNGTIHATTTASGVAELKARVTEWQRLGAPVRLLSGEDVGERVGSNAFRAGLLDERAGTINPMGYCRGLARAAKGAGAKIATGVTVTGLKRDGDGWRVDTDHGTLIARNVVLGTNAYSDDLWPGLRHIFTPIHYFQFATRPLGDEARHILPGRQALWTNARFMISIRRDASDRLLLGSMGSVLGGKDGGLSHRWAVRQLARLFPGLGKVEFDEAWHGQIAMTHEHLPRIYLLDKGLYAGAGYNGRGITTGTIFGKAMADLIGGMDPDELPIRPVPLKRDRTAPVMSRLYHLAFSANQVVRGF